MADIDSACAEERSCNVNRDTGLSTAFTIAHEIGHKSVTFTTHTQLHYAATDHMLVVL